MSRGNSSQSHAPTLPIENTKSVVSMLLSYECKTDLQIQFIMNVLDNASNLRALQFSDEEVPITKVIRIINHQSLSQITHLAISIGEEGYETLDSASFPAVQVLHLNIMNEFVPKSLPDWRFPSITSFSLCRGEDYCEGGDLFDGLDQFITLHGKRITSMLINYTTMGTDSDSRPYHSKTKFWEWFPNLQLFGPGMGALGSLSQPPSTIKLTALAICSLHTWGSTIIPYPFDIWVGELLQTCQELGIKKLVMTNSWEIPAHLNVTELSCWPRRLFEEAATNGIQVFDSDGLPATDPIAVRFIEGLSDIGST
ncbi:hypothetical protein M408DRAFT_118070 [Serendipita vermifera MAFF 305830]|uniref:Uncharacterized protein n=1 Tax=Serendipita vermifera MAFF 305830 TaxID=933852 RepID=A0A0C3ANS4_SERVB|nr:hypothetical protein M408DRAFT_118070 [Serendipita vermifera MAFF 305830]